MNQPLAHEPRELGLLVVESSTVVRRRIERSVRVARLRVLGTARDADEALRVLEQLRPDVVTLGLDIAGMDAGDCIGHMLMRQPLIRILVIGPLTDKATAIAAMHRGANGFLAQPFTEGQLNEALAELVRDA